MDFTQLAHSLDQKENSLKEEEERLKKKNYEDLLALKAEAETSMLELQRKQPTSAYSTNLETVSRLIREAEEESKRIQEHFINRSSELQNKLDDALEELVKQKVKVHTDKVNLMVLAPFTRPEPRTPSRSRVMGNPQNTLSTPDSDVLRVESYLQQYTSEKAKTLTLINPFDKLINSADWIQKFSDKNGLSPVMEHELDGLQFTSGKYTIKVFNKGIIEPISIDPPDKERILNLIVDLMLKYSEDFSNPSHILTAKDPEDRKILGKLLSQRLIDDKKLNHQVDGLSPQAYLEKQEKDALNSTANQQESETRNTPSL